MRKRRRLRVQDRIKRRDQRVAHHSLVEEVQLEDQNGFRNVLKMEEKSFEELLEKVRPNIRRKQQVWESQNVHNWQCIVWLNEPPIG